MADAPHHPGCSFPPVHGGPAVQAPRKKARGMEHTAHGREVLTREGGRSEEGRRVREGGSLSPRRGHSGAPHQQVLAPRLTSTAQATVLIRRTRGPAVGANVLGGRRSGVEEGPNRSSSWDLPRRYCPAPSTMMGATVPEAVRAPRHPRMPGAGSGPCPDGLTGSTAAAGPGAFPPDSVGPGPGGPAPSSSKQLADVVGGVEVVRLTHNSPLLSTSGPVPAPMRAGTTPLPE